MKRLLTFVFLCVALAGQGQDLSAGITFVDGQRITASQLGQLVNQDIINPAFYSSRTLDTSPLQNGDYLLLLQGGNLKKMLGSGILTNSLIISTQPTSSSAPGYASLLYYDPTNHYLRQIAVSNFVSGTVTNINVSNLVFAIGGVQLLPAYTNLFPYFSTTNQNNFLTWDTNGTPHFITLSNLFGEALGPWGTNKFVPYIYTNVFSPFSFITNSATNAWGFLANFPITNLFFTNAAQTNPALQTITNLDTIPIVAASQTSNTMVTLNALFEYLTNRLQAQTFSITNISIPTAGGLVTNVTHSLGATPRNFMWSLLCVTNDNGYVVGDVLPVTSVVDPAGTGTVPFQGGANATSVFITYRGNGVDLGNKSTAAIVVMGTNNWRLQCTAYK